ncbi:MAG: 16S rRNA (cytosine(967)-C(5))-methyltransferase RsmB [candidate division Zixibacteria bacterium]|nr:16S rRNA (cytosine(967)-C(5))-methyltransferase RsmB [candidate division Zixibacteria bacterium]
MTLSQTNKNYKVKHDPVRAAVLEALILIQQGEQADNAVKLVTAGQNFRPLDIRFLLQLVNGTTKMKRRLDHEIKFYLAKPSASLPLILANILRLGFYQLIFTSRVPAAAAVSESVNLARQFTDKSQAGMVNAVLRARLREPQKIVFISKDEDPAKYLADFYSYPDYFVQYCLDEFGPEKAEKLLEAYNQPPHVTYRVNSLNSKPDEVTHLLQENNIEFSFGRYLPEFIHIQSGGLPLEEQLIKTGKVFVQDESAGLPVRLLNPKPGDNVIDLTAAPGGKATYMAIRMRNKGRVTALDKSHRRLELLVENAQSLGIKIISPVVCDMAEFKSEPFDRVLLDPPCSGWGTAGKKADLRWKKEPQDISNLVKIQTKMIDRAARLVKPGGVLVYSTCTIMRKENDQVVEEFLLRNNDFELESGKQFFHSELVNERGFIKTYPDCGQLDGSFCARMKRKLKN